MGSNKPLLSLKESWSRYQPLWLIGFIVLLFLPVFTTLYRRWLEWDESVAHGIPVAALFLYLLWQRSPELMGRPVSRLSQYIGMLAVLFLSLLWAVFYSVDITILLQLLIIPIVMATFWVAFGFKAVLKHRLLLLLPVFAIPVWDYLNDPLLYLTSEVVGQMVRWMQMPALIQGNSIYIPYGHIMIDDGCSGLRYFVVAIALGYLVGLLNRYDEMKMLPLLLVAAFLGIVTNWIRVFALIVIGYQTEMESSLMQEHEMFGWLLFAAICLPAIYFAPVVKNRIDNREKAPVPGPGAGIMAALLVFLAAGPVMGYWAFEGEVTAEPVRQEVVGSVATSRMPMPVTAPQATEVHMMQLPISRAYFRQDIYVKSRRRGQMVPYIHRLYNHEAWHRVESRRLRDPGDIQLSVFRQQGGGRDLVQAQWFQVGQYRVSAVPAAKLWQIPASFRGQHQFTIYTLQIPCPRQGCDEVKTEMTTLLNNLMDSWRPIND